MTLSPAKQQQAQNQKAHAQAGAEHPAADPHTKQDSQSERNRAPAAELIFSEHSNTPV